MAEAEAGGLIHSDVGVVRGVILLWGVRLCEGETSECEIMTRRKAAWNWGFLARTFLDYCAVQY